MITTELYEGQGLGNQLWVYAACRSIAERLGMPFAILAEERFKGGEFLQLDFASGHNAGERSGFRGEASPRIFWERLFYDPDLDYVSSAFDGSVMDIDGYARLEGLFQSEEYFFGDLSRIRRYVAVKEDALGCVSIPDDTCVLNIRGGEYKRHKRLILPHSYWAQAMRNMQTVAGLDRFLIVTDDPRYAASLLPGIPILPGGIRECYMALHKARHLILSNSSFAYFPVKTGREDRLVIAPRYWARFRNEWSRWASPANLYESWMWQAADGSLHTYSDCVDEQEATIAYYRENYHLSTLRSVVVNPGLRGHIPQWLKKSVKRSLSLLFPRYIG